MKRWIGAPLAVVLAASASAGSVLWNNYLTPGPGHDGVSALSSERQTLAAESWVADDTLFNNPVNIEEIRWIGYREIGTGGQYPLADLIILDGSFGTIVELSDQSYTDSVIETQQILGRTYEIYEGVLNLGVNSQQLAAGHYYFGTRLVGNSLGQNFFATTGNGTLNGTTQGYTRSPSFFQNQWTPVSDVYGIQFNTDFAFQVYGTVVPEPVSLVMMLGGGLCLMLRRR